MYSRNARSDSSPNKTSDPTRPISSVSAKIAHILHQARVLAFRFSIVARAASFFALRLLAASQSANRRARPLQKRFFAFALFHEHRRPKRQHADQRHRQEFPLWQNPVQVFQIHGHQLGIWPAFRKMEESASERSDGFSRSSRPFRK